MGERAKVGIGVSIFGAAAIVGGGSAEAYPGAISSDCEGVSVSFDNAGKPDTMFFADVLINGDVAASATPEQLALKNFVVTAELEPGMYSASYNYAFDLNGNGQQDPKEIMSVPARTIEVEDCSTGEETTTTTSTTTTPTTTPTSTTTTTTPPTTTSTPTTSMPSTTTEPVQTTEAPLIPGFGISAFCDENDRGVIELEAFNVSDDEIATFQTVIDPRSIGELDDFVATSLDDDKGLISVRNLADDTTYDIKKPTLRLNDGTIVYYAGAQAPIDTIAVIPECGDEETVIVSSTTTSKPPQLPSSTLAVTGPETIHTTGGIAVVLTLLGAAALRISRRRTAI